MRWRSLVSSAFIASLALAAGAEDQPAAPPSSNPRPELPPAYFAEMAAVQHRYGLHAEAIKLYQRAIRLCESDDEKANYRMALAEVYEAAGKADDAATEWQALAASKNPVVAFRAKLAQAQRLADDGQKDKAVEVLESLALDCPIQNYRAIAAEQLGKLASGTQKLTAYHERLRKEPGNRELLALVIKVEGNDLTARAATLKEIYGADPHDLDVLRQYGQALIDASQLDEGEKLYQNVALNFPPLSHMAFEQLAKIAMRKGAPREAEKFILDAAKGMPEDVERSLYVTRQALSLGLYDMAEKYGRQGAERAKGEAMQAAVNMELGEALFYQRNVSEARALLAPIAKQDLWRGLKVRAQALMVKLDEMPIDKNF